MTTNQQPYSVQPPPSASEGSVGHHEFRGLVTALGCGQCGRPRNAPCHVAPSTGATAGEDWIRAIQQRYEDHDVVYERPAHGAPCWFEYRTGGRCNCDADGDVAVLLAEVAQLRADFAQAQAEWDGWKAAAQEEITGRHTVLEPRVQALRAQIEAMRAVVEAAQREEQRHIQRVDAMTKSMDAEKQGWYRQAHTAGCDLAGVLALNGAALDQAQPRKEDATT